MSKEINCSILSRIFFSFFLECFFRFDFFLFVLIFFSLSFYCLKAISSFASTAQYFYYTSFRAGICLPVITDSLLFNSHPLKCDWSDVHQLAQKGMIDFHFLIFESLSLSIFSLYFSFFLHSFPTTSSEVEERVILAHFLIFFK